MKSKIVVLAVVLLFSAVVEHARGDFVLTGSNYLNVTSSYNTGTLFDSSTADISSGGTVTTLYSNDTSRVTVCGGSIGTLGSYNASTVNVHSGSISTLCPNGTSNVNIHDGNISRITSYDASNITIFGGNITNDIYDQGTSNSSLKIFGGVFNTTPLAISLSAANDRNVEISGGVFNGRLYAKNASNVEISGGVFNAYLQTEGTSNLSISGGSINELYATGTSNTTFYGYDFRATGGLSLDGDTVLGTGMLIGKWLDGTSWATTIAGHNAGATILIGTVPEPSTFVLLGAGAISLLGYAWRRRKLTSEGGGWMDGMGAKK